MTEKNNTIPPEDHPFPNSVSGTLREIPVRDDDSEPNGKLLSYQQTYFINNDKTIYYQCAKTL